MTGHSIIITDIALVSLMEDGPAITRTLAGASPRTFVMELKTPRLPVRFVESPRNRQNPKR